MRRVLTAGLIICLTAALAACGSSGSVSTKPNTSSATTTSTASTSSSTAASSHKGSKAKPGAKPSSGGAALTGSGLSPVARQHALVSLASCFRSHGINLPNSVGHGALRSALRNYPQSRIDTVLQDCHASAAKALPTVKVSTAQRAQLARFARCMRSHGVRVPIPPAGNGDLFGFFLAVRKASQDSHAFPSALKACRRLAPRLSSSGR